jgi:hypothetical protein
MLSQKIGKLNNCKARNPKGLNRIAKMDYGYLYLFGPKRNNEKNGDSGDK